MSESYGQVIINSGISVVNASFNNELESILLLFSKLILEDKRELRAEGGIARDILCQSLDLRNSSFIQVLLLGDIGQNEDDLLKALILLSKDCNWVDLQKICQKLILNLCFFNIVLNWK